MLYFFIDDHMIFRCWNCCSEIEPIVNDDSTVIGFKCFECRRIVKLRKENSE